MTAITAESATHKYQPLADFLAASADSVARHTLTFKQVELILRSELPKVHAIIRPGGVMKLPLRPVMLPNCADGATPVGERVQTVNGK